jgi:RNA polymerase sigma-70 factor (ECF subfamily)
MQDVYVRILKIRSQQKIEQPKAYLYKIASSVAYEHRLRRRMSPSAVTLDEATSDEAALACDVETNAPEYSAGVTERLEGLAVRLGQLPPRVRDAILLHHRDGYTCEEIAEKLSAATHRVKKYLVKGLAHCREVSVDSRSSAPD